LWYFLRISYLAEKRREKREERREKIRFEDVAILILEHVYHTKKKKRRKKNSRCFAV
jgi:hypothetical protein